jgi:hypothetical protein
VWEISTSNTGGPGSGPRRRFFGHFANQSLIGLLTAVGVLITLLGVIVAFVAWRGDEAGRRQGSAAGGTPAVASGPATASTSGPATTSNSTPASAPTSVTGAPGTDVAEPASATATTRTPAARTPLQYQLTADKSGERMVHVNAVATGTPVSGLSYWFMLEINYGDGNIDYFPRVELNGRTQALDIDIPAGANTAFVRIGRVYALSGSEAARARKLKALQDQGPSDAEDFFPERTGTSKSNGVRMPY